jgi:hypothetical protein
VKYLLVPAALIAGGLLSACVSDDNIVLDGGNDSSMPDGGGDGSGTLTLDKTTAKLAILHATTFTPSQPATWAVQETGGGTVDANGKYVSPVTPGVYHVIATSKADAKVTATATITVVDLQLQVVAGVIGGSGNIDGPALRAHFENPLAAAHAYDNTSTRIYVADTDNHTIRVYDDSTKKVTTLAGLANTSGTSNGIGNTARFNTPSGVAINPAFNAGQILYVGDTGNHCIRAIDTSNGNVTTFSGVCGSSGNTDGSATTARFTSPNVMVMNAGSTPTAIDVCDGQSIRRVSLADGSVQTLSGLIGVYSCQLVTDRYKSRTFFTDDGDSGHLKSFYEANNAPYTPTIDLNVMMPNYQPRALGTDDGWGQGRYTYMVFNNGGGVGIYRHDEIGTTGFSPNPVIGNSNQYGWIDGAGTAARFMDVTAIDSMPEFSRLYLVDRGLNAVRKVDLNSSTLDVTTTFGAAEVVDRINGPGSSSRFSSIFGVAVDDKGVYYISDALTDGAPGLKNETVRKFDPGVGNVIDFAGVPGAPFQTAVDGVSGTFSWPFFSTWDGGVVYVVDLYANAVRAIDASGKISTIAGELGVAGTSDGVGPAAHFKFLAGQFGGAGITTDHAGHLYVSDGGNYAIRKIDIATGTVTTVAGGTSGTTNGKGKAAKFMAPCGLAVSGNMLYIVDDLDHTVRAMDLTTTDVTTFIGQSGNPGYVDGDASKALLDSPFDIVADGLGNLYFTELPLSTNQKHSGTIRRIDIASTTISTLVGTRTAFGVNTGPRTTASVNCPLALSMTPSGDLAFGDFCDHVVGLLTSL